MKLKKGKLRKWKTHKIFNIQIDGKDVFTHA